MTSVQSTRRSRQELRTRLVEEGRELLFAEGLAVGSSNLTFKRVFDRMEAKTGTRVTNASVIKRIWENQADFQADVLVTVVHDEARPGRRYGEASGHVVGHSGHDHPGIARPGTPRICRVEGNASSAAIGRSTNWSLWSNVVSMSTSGSNPGVQARIKEALDLGYQAVTRFWSENFTALADLLGLRLLPSWSIDQFSMAAIAYAEGCAFRQLSSEHVECMIRPTGPDGEDQEWSLYAVGMEALVNQFFEPDPGFAPST